MRIGILTLHDSPNYGAVLQAYALRAHLASCGHEAFLIDRRRDPGGRLLRIPPAARDSVRLLGLVKVSAHNGQREFDVRCARTEEFLRRRTGLDGHPFHSWAEVPADLGADVIVVGSDQVWNANNLNPEDYLLKGVPGSPRGIAYAASIGMPEFPADRTEAFREGFARFAAIGVREHEAVEMIRGLGFPSEHVVDPVLLADRSVWDEILRGAAEPGGKAFVYFLAEDFESMLPLLSGFARRTGRRVDFFADWFVRRAPRGLGGYVRNRAFESRWRRQGVDFRLDAGPVEFVRSIAAADVVVSNSYHALMFALKFGKDVRIVLPTHPVRRKMNARLREFEAMASGAPLVAADLPAALASLESGARVTVRKDCLESRIAASRDWLARTLSEDAR